jgi:hypothetical protein
MLLFLPIKRKCRRDVSRELNLELLLGQQLHDLAAGVDNGNAELKTAQLSM